MITITIWLLIAVGDNSSGFASVVERFPDSASCEHVRKNLPNVTGGTNTRCIQANVVREKK